MHWPPTILIPGPQRIRMYSVPNLDWWRTIDDSCKWGLGPRAWPRQSARTGGAAQAATGHGPCRRLGVSAGRAGRRPDHNRTPPPHLPVPVHVRKYVWRLMYGEESCCPWKRCQESNPKLDTFNGGRTMRLQARRVGGRGGRATLDGEID